MQLTNKKIFLKKKNFSHKKSIKYFYLFFFVRKIFLREILLMKLDEISKLK